MFAEGVRQPTAGATVRVQATATLPTTVAALEPNQKGGWNPFNLFGYDSWRQLINPALYNVYILVCIIFFDC
jgi:hypothetical protein